MDFGDLIEAWRLNNEVTRKWLESIPDDAWELKPGAGKTVRSNFVHIIGVRRSWAEVKLPKEAAGIPKLDSKSATKEEIAAALDASYSVLAHVFEKMNSAPKGKWTALSLFAYCVAHEAHHRSQIEISLRLAGKGPDDASLYSLWEWTKL